MDSAPVNKALLAERDIVIDVAEIVQWNTAVR